MRGDLFAEKRVSRLTEALRLGLAHADEVVAPGGQLGEAALGRVSRWRRPRRQRAAERGQHLGIDPVGPVKTGASADTIRRSLTLEERRP